MAGEQFEHGCCADKKTGRGKPCTPETCMSLPVGESCATCYHCSRCVALFGAKAENTWCDFFPRRFHKVEVVK